MGLSYHAKGRVKYNIERFIKDVEALNLTVTSNTDSYKYLTKLKEKFDKTEEDYELNEEDVEELAYYMHRLREINDAELTGRKVFIITEKRMNVEKLLDSINEFFASNTFNNLPDLPRSDFSESGKCIAFERATAAGFHVLRGMEGVLRCIFQCIMISIFKKKFSRSIYSWIT